MTPTGDAAMTVTDVSPRTTDLPDCTACGACCVEAGSVTVRLGDDVPARRTRSVRGRMGYCRDDHLLGIREMRTEEPGTRCASLVGTVGVDVRCAIHPRRPRTCREFVPGSGGCHEARATMLRKRARMEHKPLGYDERPLGGPQPPAAATWGTRPAAAQA